MAEVSQYYFFNQLESNTDLTQPMMDLIERLKEFSEIPHESNGQKTQIYIVQNPLIDKKYTNTNISKAFVILSPKYPLIFINFSDDEELFAEFYEDFIEDLGSISDRFNYKEIVGRPRQWKNKLTIECQYQDLDDIKSFFDKHYISDTTEQRRVELLISLLTGSINDIEKIDSVYVAENLLDQVKQKILLFDGNQTNFLYKEKNKKIITIQGLSGTGKTELLLHKLKELYTESDSTKIFFTCFNLVLADSLKKRIPKFFNFMKVQQQIEWNERLWCERAWGALHNNNSGLYRYICYFYGLPFYNYRQCNNFGTLAKRALDAINQNEDFKDKFAFDYILIDERQDFSEEFIKLCERVTSKKVFVAGDIFQNIFGQEEDVDADYLLNQCYRTDPRTLMFAHSVGMGLFEKPVLKWLTDIQWLQYGYKILDNDGQFRKFTRDPIRRFEDIQDDCLKVFNINDLDELKIARLVVQMISNIRDKYETVKPEDIALIFMTTDRNYMSHITGLVSNLLSQSNIDWVLNRAFESKEQIDGELFVTNHNNVKGLEFPFVICISPFELDKNTNKRNALYMALTRSFIQTILLLPISKTTLDMLQSGLSNIMNDHVIKVIPPSPDELLEVTAQLEFNYSGEQSHKELVYQKIEDEFKMSKIDDQDKEWIYEQVYNVIGANFDINKIDECLKKTYPLYDMRKNKSS